MTQAQQSLLELQQSVQRKLGRNLLRLQQYERGVKALIAVSDIEGAADEFQVRLARRKEAVAGKTLGALVGMLTGDYLTPAVREEPEETVAEREALARNQVFFRIQSHLALSPEDYEQTVKDLAQLVGMRNELVHHFMERFDLLDAGGCQKADSHLDDCLAEIEKHWQRLISWAEAHDAAREKMVEFMRTPEFVDAFIHGIETDGQVAWPRATVIAALRQAESRLARDG